MDALRGAAMGGLGEMDRLKGMWDLRWGGWRRRKAGAVATWITFAVTLATAR